MVAPRTAMKGNIGLEITLPFVGNEDIKTVLCTLRKKDGVLFAMET